MAMYNGQLQMLWGRIGYSVTTSMLTNAKKKILEIDIVKILECNIARMWDDHLVTISKCNIAPLLKMSGPPVNEIA